MKTDYTTILRVITALNIENYAEHKPIEDKNLKDYFSWAGESIYYEDNPFDVEPLDDEWVEVEVTTLSISLNKLLKKTIKEVESLSDSKFIEYLKEYEKGERLK